MNPKIWLSSPHMGGEELNFVNQAFDTNWIAPLGPNVNGFEEDLQNYTGVKHAAALSSGTAALHLALIMLGVKQDDEVICQSLTFSATANPIAYQGAVPIFIDSENKTWNMDPNILEDAVKDRIAKGKEPKAIIYVHLYGMPALINDIMEVANKYEIPLIEDAAEALGSRYLSREMRNISKNGLSREININSEDLAKLKAEENKIELNPSEKIISLGEHVGGFSDIGILSFNGNKIITTSGGGALISNKEEFVTKARFLATQARDNAPHYQHSQIGYNYRMSNIVAGIGRGQMKVIDKRVEQRRANYDFYKDQFTKFDGITFLDEPVGHFSNRWLTTFLVDSNKTNGVSRENIRLELEKYNIESRPLWKPMHKQPVFQNALNFTNGTSEKLFEDGLCLPSGSNLSEDDLARIVGIIFSILTRGQNADK
ncbi:MAG: aminotransferase class I/II-fold pyridoxal phosphate-dependent enzyme [Bacteroidetes bacterium]|nr:aminotransferase class I/II-fold pyridoxal phosphate-dependent enzyme [Bacteroidota bacterium]